MINHIHKRGRIWWWKYRTQGARGAVQDISLRTPDRQVAERRRMDLLAEREREAAGIIAPKLIRDGAQKPLLADLEKQGKESKYLANIRHRVGILIKQCGWHTAKDVTSDSFLTWRNGQKLSPKTLNDYLDACRRLFIWLEKNQRVMGNPLRWVGKLSTVGHQTHQRRAFSAKELHDLFAVSPADRKTLYLMAVNTGIRRGEFMALRWGDLHLEAVQPFVSLRAVTTKNRKADLLPMRAEVVAALREIKPSGVEEAALVFPRFPRIERFRRDLVKAKIQYENETGIADFHALRYTFCTNLGNAGVPPAVRQALMRHSDSRLTERIYTDKTMLATWSAVDKLPNLTESLSQGVSQKLDINGNGTSQNVTHFNGADTEQSPVNIEENHDMALAVANGPNVLNWRERRGSNPQPLP